MLFRSTIDGKTYTFDENFILEYTGAATGGKANFDEASYNKITISDGEAHININGGDFTGKLYQNTFNFNNLILELNLSNASNYKLNFDSNTFSINGGTHSNSYISMPNVTSTNNTVNISGSPDLSNFYIYSNYFGDAGTNIFALSDFDDLDGAVAKLDQIDASQVRFDDGRRFDNRLLIKIVIFQFLEDFPSFIR